MATIDLGAGGPGLVVIVADGMGGVAGGSTASTLTVQVIAEAVGALPEALGGADSEWQRRLSGWLRGAGVNANRAVRQLAADQPTLRGMGTTLLLGLVVDGWLGLAWVGDSRAYLLRGGTLVQLTRDHTWEGDRELEGRVDDPSVLESPYRGLLTSAIGHKPELELGIRWEALTDGDLLLLSTDGLTRYYDGEGLASYLAAANAAGMAATDLADQLVAMANSAGGADNTSVGLVRVGALPRRRLPQPVAATQSQVPHRAWQAPLVPAAPVATAMALPAPTQRRIGQVAALGAGSVLFLAVGAMGAVRYFGDHGQSPPLATVGGLGASPVASAASGASASADGSEGGTADSGRVHEHAADAAGEPGGGGNPDGASAAAPAARADGSRAAPGDRGRTRSASATAPERPSAPMPSRTPATGASVDPATSAVPTAAGETATSDAPAPQASGGTMVGTAAERTSADDSASARRAEPAGFWSELGGDFKKAGDFVADAGKVVGGAVLGGVRGVGKAAGAVGRLLGGRDKKPAGKGDSTARPPTRKPATGPGGSDSSPNRSFPTGN